MPRQQLSRQRRDAAWRRREQAPPHPSAPDDTGWRVAPLAPGAGRGHFCRMRYSAAGLVLLWIAGPASCAATDSAGEYGPRPTIPAPTKSLIPTLNVAKARGWKEGLAPRSATGTAV